MQNFWSNMPLGYYGPTHNSKTLKDGKVVGTSGVWCSIKWWRGLIGPIPWWLTVVGSLCSKWNGPGDIRYIESTHHWFRVATSGTVNKTTRIPPKEKACKSTRIRPQILLRVTPNHEGTMGRRGHMTLPTIKRLAGWPHLSKGIMYYRM
jgi:hypothetical protein